MPRITWLLLACYMVAIDLDPFVVCSSCSRQVFVLDFWCSMCKNWPANQWSDIIGGGSTWKKLPPLMFLHLIPLPLTCFLLPRVRSPNHSKEFIYSGDLSQYLAPLSLRGRALGATGRDIMASPCRAISSVTASLNISTNSIQSLLSCRESNLVLSGCSLKHLFCFFYRISMSFISHVKKHIFILESASIGILDL